jgi:GTPase KRas protein
MADGKFEEYKVVVCGPGGAGKSCLTNMLVVGLFTEEYDPTIEDSYRKQVQVDGEDAVLDILDTAGQEEYSSMLDEYLRKGQGFLLVYSITSRESFEEIPGFMEKMLRAKDSKQVPTVLVGNKKDLEHKREVPYDEGALLAKNIGATFLESSAKLGEGVEEAFYNLIRAVRKDRDAKGYSLIKTKAPGKEMEHKLKKKFARWGRLKAWFRRDKKSKKSTTSNTSTTTTTNQPAKSSPATTNNTSNPPAQQAKTQPQPQTQPQQQSQPAQTQPVQGSSGVGNANNHLAGGQDDESAYGGDPSGGSAWNQPAYDNQQHQQHTQPPQQQQYHDNSTTPGGQAQPAYAGGGAYGGGPHDQAQVAQPAPVAPQVRDHTQEPWFHGSITGPEADALLEPCEAGTFLVRSSAQAGCFAVSWKSEDQAVRKSLVIQDASVGFYFSDVPHAPYPTLAELVAASSHVLQFPYVNRNRPAGGAPVAPVQDAYAQPPESQYEQQYPPADQYAAPDQQQYPQEYGQADYGQQQQYGYDPNQPYDPNQQQQQYGQEQYPPAGGYGEQDMGADYSMQPGAEIHVGARVRWMGQHLGFVRFYGEGNFAKGIWVGIELDEPCGKNDGTVKGQRYFNCNPGHGIFTNPNKVEVLSG